MKSDLDPEEQELAEAVIVAVQPDELNVLRSLALHPSWRQRRSGGSIGYGAELPIEMIAPYVILVAVWVKSIIQDEAQEVAEQRLRRLVRRLLGAESKVTQRPRPPKSDDVMELRGLIATYAAELGLQERRAHILADAVLANIDILDREQ